MDQVRGDVRRVKLHISHPLRVERRDLKLWRRERSRARRFGHSKIRCPCNRCKGQRLILLSNVEGHLIREGRHEVLRWWKDEVSDWDSSDDEWVAHFTTPRNVSADFMVDENDAGVGDNSLGDDCAVGEDEREDPLDNPVEVDMNRMITDLFADLDATRENLAEVGVADEAEYEFEEPPAPTPEEMEEQARLATNEKLLLEACRPLYPGARMTILSFTMMLLNICSQHNVPNVVVDELLVLLKEKALPEKNEAPAKHYQAKILIRRLGLDYESIHACPKGCVLFRGEFATLQACPKCKAERYFSTVSSQQPKKVLRHFPIIPRLLRMFRVTSIASLLRWSAENKSEDGLVRHAGDSKAWKHVDLKFKEFGREPRNIRFGLALDGVNPFSDKSTSWSTWPILLVNYNLPPWLCTKRFFIQLALLIPGKESVKGHNIDVYLAPLLEELHKLWAGIPAEDVSAEFSNRKFTLRAMLLWTINDYPALGTISGQSTAGYLSCVCCGPRVQSEYSKHLHKNVVLGHRKYLKMDHPYRKRRYAHHFDNKRELDPAPHRVSAEEIIEWAEMKRVYDEGGGKEDGPQDPYKTYGVKRLPIFFSLPYWKHLLIRNPVDVMHTEKNVADCLLHMILGDSDSPKVRRDLEERNIRPELWLRRSTTRAGVWVKPGAPYVLTKKGIQTFKDRLSALRVPSGYCGSLKKHILQDTIGHMKSHDFHVFMQQLLPVLIRGLMDKDVTMTIMRLCRLFRRICTKVWDPKDIGALQEEAAVTLVLCEMHFPPSFFNNMTHLVYHLVEELDLCGPVHCRWMYPIERYLSVMKRYVKNRARPEACMAECYLQDQSLGFTTEYMANFNPVHKRVWTDQEDEGVRGDIREGAPRALELTVEERDIAHKYVLENSECLRPWIKKMEDAKERKEIDEGVHFSTWIQEYLRNDRSEETHDHYLRAIAFPPRTRCRSYRSVRAFGNHFRVVPGAKDIIPLTYDSGIAVLWSEGTAVGTNNEGQGSCRFSAVGTLSGILQLDYGLGRDDPVVFRGSWVKPIWEGYNPPMQFDDQGFLLVQLRSRLGPLEDPFVFPTQVEQVFFAPVKLENPEGWNIVIRKDARSRRVFGSSLDSTRGEYAVFDALEAPLVLPTGVARVNLVDASELTPQELLADA